MKSFKYIMAACSLFAMTSCLDKFQDLNTNDEQLGNADPRNVFTGATLNFNNSSRAHLTGKYSGAMRYMQYVVSASGAADGIYFNPSKSNSFPSVNSPQYSDYYSACGLYLTNLIQNNIPVQDEPERYSDVAAISQILLNYKQWQILDVYGAAPINEAFKAQSENIRTPRYDLYQESINGTPMYKQIDEEVKAAVEQLKNAPANQYALGTNDFFYNGDVQKWIKFGNSLRVKMAQRVEKADPDFYNSVIAEVLTSADNIIASNDESCIYNHTNDYNNNVDDIQGLTSNYCAAAAFVNYLKAYDDPRLHIMVRPNGFGTGNNNVINDSVFSKIFAPTYPDYETSYAQFLDRYVGMSANPDSSETTLNKNAYLTLSYTTAAGVESSFEIRTMSQVESRYFVKNGGSTGNANMPSRAIESSDYEINQDKMHTFTPIMTYPEVCFMVAEIAVKKGGAVAGKDATTWFRDGIRASMQQYADWATSMYVVAQVNETSATFSPVTDAKIEAYLARPEFQTATLEKIISQQWINLYMQPEEMWATWKRTGLPAFKAQPTPENGVAFLEEIHYSGAEIYIPRRNALSTPNSLNMDNYNTAVENMMKDAKYGNSVNYTLGRIWWDVE
jgi:hypothetical protein